MRDEGAGVSDTDIVGGHVRGVPVGDHDAECHESQAGAVGLIGGRDRACTMQSSVRRGSGKSGVRSACAGGGVVEKRNGKCLLGLRAAQAGDRDGVQHRSFPKQG